MARTHGDEGSPEWIQVVRMGDIEGRHMKDCIGCAYCKVFSADGAKMKYQCANRESPYYRAIFTADGWGCEKHS